MKRLFDVVVALLLAPPCVLAFVTLWLLIRLSGGKPVIFWSVRIGRDNKTFMMPKFRTMKLGTPQVATHLLDGPDQHLTRTGKFLRKTSLDEIPQLYCILNGDMSFVGPRPALFNQEDLIRLRTDKTIHRLRPGLTGWAQINGRDDISIEEKVKLDTEYLRRIGILFDFEIIAKTFLQVVRGNGVAH
jgi:O-antigen biosynthesis protein WbqP